MLGALPPYAGAVGVRWDTATYFVGSLFFTTAAFLTYREAVDAGPLKDNPSRRRVLVFQPRRIDWWASAVQLAPTLLNLLGSIAFGVSAVASYVIPATGELRDAERANLGTLVGAICFLIGALLLLPERTEEIDPDAASGGERPARP